MPRVSSFCGFLFIVVMVSTAATQVSAAESIAELVAMSGRVDILRNGKLPSEKARVGAQLFVGDFIRTKSKSSAEVLFADGNRVKIDARSRVDISIYSTESDERTLGLARGKLEAIIVPGGKVDSARRPRKFEIHTPNAVAGVRGTALVVAFQDSITAIHVKESHSGRAVYSLSKFHPGRIFDIPVGGMMWVRNRGLPTTMPPSADLGFSLLAQGLTRGGELGGLQVLVDALTGAVPLPPVISDAFPETLGVEVGVVDMGGTQFLANHNFDVAMTASFIALSPDTAPVSWRSDNVTLNWASISVPSPFDPTGQSVVLSGNGPVGQADAVFTVLDWDTNSGVWAAGINSGFGTVPNGTQFEFAGSASGSGAVTTSAASTTGTASGVAIESGG